MRQCQGWKKPSQRAVSRGLWTAQTSGGGRGRPWAEKWVGSERAEVRRGTFQAKDRELRTAALRASREQWGRSSWCGRSQKGAVQADGVGRRAPGDEWELSLTISGR